MVASGRQGIEDHCCADPGQASRPDRLQAGRLLPCRSGRLHRLNEDQLRCSLTHGLHPEHVRLITSSQANRAQLRPLNRPSCWGMVLLSTHRAVLCRRLSTAKCPPRFQLNSGAARVRPPPHGDNPGASGAGVPILTGVRQARALDRGHPLTHSARLRRAQKVAVDVAAIDNRLRFHPAAH